MLAIIAWVVVVSMAVLWLGVVVVGPPFVPTLKKDLDTLFTELKLNHQDRVVDLGAGDGRVLAAAAKYGAKVSGVEINPLLVWIARLRFKQVGRSIVVGDMWRYEIPEDTTHVFVFPAEVFMNKLERYCVAQAARIGSFTVMCYGFGFAGRKPEKTIGAFNIYRF